MSGHSKANSVSHENKNTDLHMDWGFRREAVVWADKSTQLAPNFYPLATELRAWMKRKGSIRFFSAEDKMLPQTYTNPYTYDGSVLSIAYGQIVNDSAAFYNSEDVVDETQAEIRRIRLYTRVFYTQLACRKLSSNSFYFALRLRHATIRERAWFAPIEGVRRMSQCQATTPPNLFAGISA